MASRDLELKLILTPQDGGLKAVVRGLNGDLIQLGTTGRNSGIAIGTGLTAARNKLASISTQLAQARNLLLGFFGVSGARDAITGVFKLADAYESANLKLKFFTESNEEYVRAQESVFAIAQATRTGLVQTAELYGRVQASVRSLNGTQEQALALTQAINQASALAGGSGDGGAAAEKIVKVFTDGKIEAREFKSILNEFPGVGKAVADGLGISIEEVVQRVADGQLSLADFYGALLKQKDQIAEAYSLLPVQVDQAMVALKNSMARAFGESESVKRFTDNLAGAITGLSRNLETAGQIIYRVGAVAGAVYFTVVIPAVVKTIAASTLLAKVQLLEAAASNNATRAALAHAQALLAQAVATQAATTGFARLAATERVIAAEQGVTAATNATGFAAIFAGSAVTKFGTVLQLAGAVTAGLQFGGFLYEQSSLVRKAGAIIFQGVLEIAAQAVLIKDLLAAPFTDATVGDAMRNYSDRVQKLRADMKLAREEAEKPLFDAGAGMAGIASPDLSGGLSGGASATDTAQDNLRRSLELSVTLTKSASDRRRAILDAELEDGKITLTAYFEQKRRLEERDLTAAINAKRGEQSLTKDLAERNRLDAEILDLIAQRSAIGPRVAREQGKAERELAEQLAQVRQGMLEATGEDLQARLDKIAEKFRKIRREATAKGQRDFAIYDQAEEAEKAAAYLENLNRQIEQAEARFASKRAAAQADATAGLIPTLGARGRIDKAGDDLRASLEDSKLKVEALINDPNYSGDRTQLQKLLTSINDKIAEVGTESSRALIQIKDGIENGLTSSLSGFIAVTKSAKEAFKDFAQSVVQALSDVIARMIAVRIIGAAIGLFDSGAVTTSGSENVPLGGEGFETTAKDGGFISRAPGGIVRGPGGPRDDKIPAMLSNGEFVIQAAAVRKLGLNFLTQVNRGFMPAPSRPLLAYAAGGLVGASFNSGGGGSTEVNVYNQSPNSAATVERRQSGGREIVDIVIKQVARNITEGGEVGRAIQSVTGARRPGRVT